MSEIPKGWNTMLSAPPNQESLRRGSKGWSKSLQNQINLYLPSTFFREGDGVKGP